MLRALWSRMTAAGQSLRASTDIGNVLLKMGLVDEQTLEHACRKQMEQERKSRIGEILIDMGCLSREQLENALYAQKLMRNGRQTEAMASMVENKTRAMTEHLVAFAKR